MSSPINRLNEKIPPLQIKVFSRWVSLILRKRGIIVKDVTTQLITGVNLMNLAEVLTGDTEHRSWSRNPTKPFQKVENCELALELFKNKGTSIVNVTAKEITDGNVKRTISLLWTLILKFTIEPITVSIPYQASQQKRAMLQSLMRWFMSQIKGYDGISELKPYYLSFAALLNHYRSDSIDYNRICQSQPIIVAQNVVDVMTNLNIPLFFDAPDFLDSEVDEKSLFTQIAVIKNELHQQCDEEDEINRASTTPFAGCESEEIGPNDDELELDIDDDSQIFPKEIFVFEEPQSSRPFMLFMTITDFNNPQASTVMSMAVIKGDHFLNSAGLKIDLVEPDPTDLSQLFTFGEGEWITVIDSLMQPGMVWDVADKDSLNPPEGTPFYMFMFHGRHNQRFTYKNGHIIAKQNGQVVTYVGGETPMVMRNDNSSLLQTFRLQYI